MRPDQVMTVAANFRHEALLYASADGLADRVTQFVGAGLAAREPVLVAVHSTKLPGLRQAIPSGAEFVAMEDVGRNPGRLISLWDDFFVSHAAASRTVWGIGEPIYQARDAAEVAECQIHERLLNDAFSDVAHAFRLGCPYDRQALATDVLTEMGRSHPLLSDEAKPRASGSFRMGGGLDGAPLGPLPAEGVTTFSFGRPDLASLRRHVAAEAGRTGVAEERTGDVVLAVNEIAVNSVVYAGTGRLATWGSDGHFFCQIDDAGSIADPLAGRRRPRAIQERGRGIWIAHQVSDLVQLRTGPEGTTIRLRFVINQLVDNGTSHR